MVELAERLLGQGFDLQHPRCTCRASRTSWVRTAPTCGCTHSAPRATSWSVRRRRLSSSGDLCRRRVTSPTRSRRGLRATAAGLDLVRRPDAPSRHGVESTSAWPGRTLILVENLTVPFDRPRLAGEPGAPSRGLRSHGHLPPRPEARYRAVRAHRGRGDPPLPASMAGGSLRGTCANTGPPLRELAALAIKLRAASASTWCRRAIPPSYCLASALPLKSARTGFVFDHHDLGPELFRSRFGPRTPLPRESARRATCVGLADDVIRTNESYRRVAQGRGRSGPSTYRRAERARPRPLRARSPGRVAQAREGATARVPRA